MRLLFQITFSLSVLLLLAYSQEESPETTLNEQVPASASEEVQKGDSALKLGDYRRAISYYTKAIELAPETVSSYYKRAAAYLAVPETIRYALSDLDRVLKETPDSEQALLRRGKIYIDLGSFDKAQRDFEAVLEIKPSNSLARTRLELSQELPQQYQTAKKFFEREDWTEAKQQISLLIEKSTENTDARLMRANCNFKLGDYYGTLEDTTRVLKQDPTLLEGYFLRGESLFQLGQGENSVQVFRECLRSDPDYKPCKNSFRFAKKVLKLVEGIEKDRNERLYQSVSEKLDELLSLDPPTFYKNNIWIEQCSNFLAMKDYDSTISSCSKVIEIQGDDYDSFMNRADAKMQKEDYSGALFDYRKAADMRPRDSRARNGIFNAEKQQKMSARKDYYKILGVEKSASSREISKAFRTLAREKHPDKCPDEEKKNCAIEFQDINEAYEVLSDDDKKRKYDSGEDIDMPHQHQQQGFRWSSGGFTFTF